MRAICVVSAVLLLVASAAPACAEDWSLAAWSKRASPWKGHGVGSSTTEETTVELPEMPDIPNMPDMPGLPKGGKMVTTTTTTLVKITETDYVLKVETTAMGRTSVSERTEPKVGRASIAATDVGRGSVTVDGNAYECVIRQVEDMSALLGDSMPKGGPGMRPTMGAGKVWEHAKLGVLKVETTIDMMGQEASATWQVRRLATRVTVGGRTFTGREISMTTKMAIGTSTVTMVSSQEVPGTLQQQMSADFMGRKSTSTTVMTAYVKKPLAVTTPSK